MLNLQPSSVDVGIGAGQLVVRIRGELAGVSVIHAIRRRQEVSNRVERSAKEADLGYSVVFAVDDAKARLDTAVDSVVKALVGDAVSHVRVDVARSGNVRISLTLERSSPEARIGLEKLLGSLISRKGLALVECAIVEPLGRLSDLRLLRVVKRLAPCDGDQVATEVERVLRTAVSGKAMQHRLDALRQRGLLAHVGNGAHVLTLSGLSALPSEKGRTASDVERALTLGKRARYNRGQAGEADSR